MASPMAARALAQVRVWPRRVTVSHDRGRRASVRKPGGRCRCRPGSRGDRDCLRSSWDARRCSPPAGRPRFRQRPSRWHRTTACPPAGRWADGHREPVRRGRRPHRAAADPRQGQRGPHQREELAAAEPVGPDLRLLRKLPLDDLLKGLAVGQLLEAPPVLLALRACQGLHGGGQFGAEVLSADHRWQTVQLVRLMGSLTPYCLTSFRPSSNWFLGCLYFMLNTSSRGRICRSGLR